MVEQLFTVDGLADIRHEQAILARLTLGLEADPRIAAAGGGHILDGNLLEQLAAGRCLTGLGLVGGEPCDERLQLLDLLFGALILILDELLHQLARLVPEVIVADIHFDLAVVDIDDVRADVIEEVTVMRYDEHGAVVIHQEILQPDDARKVEVVRRLVEQDDVRVAEERLRKQDLHLQARIHVGHHGLMKLRRDAQSLQDARGVRLRLPAAEIRKFLLKLGSADAVLVRHLVLGVDGVLFLAAVIQALIAHDHRIHDGVGVMHRLILLEHGHSRLGIDMHAAGARLELTGEDLQECGFSGAVCADDAVAVAWGELQVYLGKQRCAAVLQREVINSDHLGNSFVTFEI